ncbi:MAG: glycosyltransferase family 4 protein [Bacteroidia bacterium]|nr:glycosyltransferase family 4 protein [Bacteroidia bacterium]
MKILVIGSRVPFPLRDGGAIATYNLLRGLCHIGLEVDYVTLNTDKHFVDKATLKNEFGFLNKLLTFDIDTSVKPFPALLNLFSKKSYNIQRFVSKQFSEKINQLCRQNHYDIIHFEGLFVADYVKGIECDGVKILRQHNIEYKIWETLSNNQSIGLKRWYTKLLSKRLKEYEKRIHQYFNAVVSITENDRQDTINLIGYKGTTKYIPAGIMPHSESTENIDYNSIYHIGSMEWLPNQEAMKWFHDSVWPLIEKSDNRLSFHMAGKNMDAQFEKYAINNFKVWGEIANLNTFIKDKSILVVPLKSGSGIRIKTIEAMMAGKAVVTTTQGAQGLDIVDGVQCLIADDAKKFADKIIMLIKDVAFRNKMAESGKQYAESNFGNDAVSEKWMKFYEEVLARSC